MIMTATITQIISNVLAALIIIIMAIAFTSVYWCLKFDHELKIQKRRLLLPCTLRGASGEVEHGVQPTR